MCRATPTRLAEGSPRVHSTYPAADPDHMAHPTQFFAEGAEEERKQHRRCSQHRNLRRRQRQICLANQSVHHDFDGWHQQKNWHEPAFRLDPSIVVRPH
jgi:uncharacterized protein (DUF2345 family)